MTKLLSFTEAIREATEQSLARDPRVVVMGLGVSYKNGADGTMGTLKEQYPNRVFDTPVSEFCNTGVGVGSAITGLRPIIHHARVEFGIFAIDQIVTQAAKWNYMFGGGNSVPIVFRLAVGRQWGNGPQHTQALYSLFGNVSGLKVVIPSTPKTAKGLLNAAVADNNPVVYLEPRWLYSLKEEVSEEYYETPLDKARIVVQGKDITLVTYGDGVVDAIRASKILMDKGISVEVIDLVSINPVDYNTVYNSVSKTGKLLCLDTTNAAFNIGGEIVSKVCVNCFGCLSQAPQQLSTPNVPCPTSTSLTEIFYPTKVDVVNKVLEMFKMDRHEEVLSFDDLHFAPKITVTT
jgi:pyruvate dehydrogenase E1 component beta subunit